MFILCILHCFQSKGLIIFIIKNRLTVCPPPRILEMTSQGPLFSFNYSPTYKNCNCATISISQNGSDVQEAPNMLIQAKLCHFEQIEKLAPWYILIK